MGIAGLHKELKHYCRPTHVSQYRGRRIGIDGFAWLHRGAVGCGMELQLGTTPWVEAGQDPPYVEFCLRMTFMLQHFGCIPVLVFDGAKLPAKSGTSEKRRERKQAAITEAHSLLQRGMVEEAKKKFMQTVDVTPEMTNELIQRLRHYKVEYVVAPYEADAQLAYLSLIPENQGGVEAVVTEDGDLVAYGCKRLLFKCDLQGNAQELDSKTLYAGNELIVSQLQQDSNATNSLEETNATEEEQGGGKKKGGGGGKKTAKIVCFKGWTVESIRAACVLAGCDFLDSVHGVQFKTAYGVLAPIVPHSDPNTIMKRALFAMKNHKRFSELITNDYQQAAHRAYHTFTHALVYDLRQQQCIRLNSPLAPELLALSDEERSFLGPDMTVELARGIANGTIHPNTKEPLPLESIPLPRIQVVYTAVPPGGAPPYQRAAAPVVNQGQQRINSWVFSKNPTAKIVVSPPRQQQQQQTVRPPAAVNNNSHSGMQDIASMYYGGNTLTTNQQLRQQQQQHDKEQHEAFEAMMAARPTTVAPAPTILPTSTTTNPFARRLMQTPAGIKFNSLFRIPPKKDSDGRLVSNHYQPQPPPAPPVFSKGAAFVSSQKTATIASESDDLIVDLTGSDEGSPMDTTTNGHQHQNQNTSNVDAEVSSPSKPSSSSYDRGNGTNNNSNGNGKRKSNDRPRPASGGGKKNKKDEPLVPEKGRISNWFKKKT